ncbi:MAG: tRNA (adenosine(37)-N6)-threonylcarbamoyltransferase complex dimerization subunit type 1 TsaB [Planctomycetes bacterium]|nr:tRNA (adenosine(37)-N6)-threonylcarbamoyltransferase complex dimerization subunit type 1 TsaB [Planctomycetota bacterium]
MKVIGIETSSIQGGVSILEETDNSITLQRSTAFRRGLVHGKLLVPALDKLLKRAHWRKDKIDLVAVDIGPGSYTGLRVGLAIAKTMAYALKTKIVGVVSLDVLVRNVSANDVHQYICPVIDARWNQVYTAIYEKSADGYKRRTDYLAITPEDLLKVINRYRGEILLFGDGLRAYSDIFKRLANRAEFAPEHLWLPSAANVATLGYESYQSGKRDDPIKLLPLYLRLTEAELNLKSCKRRTTG